MLRSTAGCIAGLLREARAALERLDDEVVGDVAREPEVDRGVDQGLHDEEHVGRAGAGDRGRHRDPLLVLDLELRAERPEQRRRLVALLRGRRRASRTRPSCPLPMRAGVLGIARTTWSWPRVAVRTLVVGPASTDRTSWPAPQAGPISRPDPREHLGLDREDDDVGARRPPRRCDRPCGCRGRPPSASRRSAAGGSRRPARPTRLPRSSPAIIASAMTPEPTVAIVRFARVDIAPEDSTGSAGSGRSEALSRPRRPRAGRTGRRSCARCREARRRERRVHDPGSCQVQAMPSGGPPPGSGWSSIEPGGRRAGAAGGARRRPCRDRRRAPGPARKRGEQAVGAGLARARRTPTGRRRGCARAGGGRRAGRARVERRAVGVRDVELALARDQREKNPTPAAGSSIRPARGWSSSQRVTTSSSASHAVSWRAPRANSPRRRNQSSGNVVAAGGGSAARRRGGWAGAAPGGTAAPAVRRPRWSPAFRRRALRRPGPRSRRAGARAGTRCRRPCRGRSSTAGPSPRGRPVPRVDGGAAPQAVEGRAERQASARAAESTRRPGVGRRHAVERGRVEQLGEQLDAVDDPRPGPRELAPSRRPRTPAASRTARRSAQPVGPRRAAPTRRRVGEAVAAGHQHDDLGVDLGHRVPGRLDGPAALLAEQLPATRPAHLLGHPVAGRERRVEPLEADDARRRDAVRRGARRPRLDRPPSRSRRISTTSTASSSASVIAPTVEIVLRMPSIDVGSRLTPSCRRRSRGRPR